MIAMPRIRPRLLAIWALIAWAGWARSQDAIARWPSLEGETFVHDPSTIYHEGGLYFLAGTGRGLITMTSPDLVRWTRGEPIFESAPSWALDSIPRFRGHIWAPDLIRINGRYLLYYSVSRFGRQTSAIGLATSSTLDADSPDYHWTDHGPVLRSEDGSPYNAIDPSLFQDTNGKLWMTFGSFWKGLYLVELNPETGRRADENSPPLRLAWHEEIEAPCLMKRRDAYYLFVNWGKCCQGTNSTYEVRVGRSHSVTGPYLDDQGIDLVEGGGRSFLQSAGRYVGPGHIALVRDGGGDQFSYHYYDRDTQGRSRLGIGRLSWTTDGWPRAHIAPD